MHIHGNFMNMNAADSYSTANAGRAAAAERAAAVRKKLLRGAASVDESATPEETLMISRWLAGSQGQNESNGEYYAGSSGKNSYFA